MLLSDTIYYRADGSVSSVVRVTRSTYIKPSGAEAIEDAEATVTLDAVSEQIGGACAVMDAQNRQLEAQIITEREAAAGVASARAASHAETAAQLAAKAEALSATEASLSEKTAALEAAQARIAELTQPSDPE